MRSSQDDGRAHEERFAARWGMIPTPQSGGGMLYKLDVGALEVLVELKWTKHASYRLTATEVRKALDGAGGPASRDKVMLMGIEMEPLGEDLIVAKASDMLAILSGQVQIEVPPTKIQARRAAAAPALRGER